MKQLFSLYVRLPKNEYTGGIMANVYEAKTEIEEIRHLLNAVIADMGAGDCNPDILLGISARIDKLILEYMKNEEK
mgnify:CR=1 FL=1